MSFVTEQSEKFAQVLTTSPYNAQDPIVKINYVQKGNNVIFGKNQSDDCYSNLIYIGKVFENTVGKSYLSADAWLDIAFPHVIYITGTRGSGKSFDLGVLIEGISKLQASSTIQKEVEPLCSILIDTQSQFWTLQYPPNPRIEENQRQLEQLQKWNIKPSVLASCELYIPPGTEKITGNEKVFHIKANQIRHEEWCALIGQETYSPQGFALGQALDQLQHQGHVDYSIDDIIRVVQSSAIQNIQDTTKDAVVYKLDGYRRTGLFDKNGLDVKDLLKPGQCSVFMLRDIRNEDKALITGIIARQLSSIMGQYHKKRKVNRFFDKKEAIDALPSKVWLLIDEAHVIAPSDGMSPAKAALIDYVKRGRDAGLSLVMATQQPSAVDDRILSQVNLSFSHRLSFQSDINAVINRIPTKLLNRLRYQGTDVGDFGDMLRYLEAGECFLGDFNSSRTIMLTVRPRVTSHGGYSPK